MVKKAPPITTHPPAAPKPHPHAEATPAEPTVAVKKQEAAAPAKKKEKKGLFANFRKKLKSGGKSDEGKGASVRGEEVRVEKVGKREGVSKTGSEGEEEREEREKQELYRAIGYSEDEEYVEFPREASGREALVG